MRPSSLLLAAAIAAPASAATTITFEELASWDRPARYYAGGQPIYGPFGSGTGPNGPDLGVTFSPEAFVLVQAANCPGGVCNGVFPDAPSGVRAIINFPLTTQDLPVTTINIPGGFTGRASIWHYGADASITVYEGLGGRIAVPSPVLGFLAMPQTTGCVQVGVVISGCGFTRYTIDFGGTARSVVLAGGGAVFDDLTLGAPGVPEPANWAMLLAGFSAVGVAMRRRPALRAVAA